MNDIEKGGVILVDEDDNLLAGLGVCCLDQFREPVVVVCSRLGYAVSLLVFRKTVAKVSLQLVLLHVLA